MPVLPARQHDPTAGIVSPKPARTFDPDLEDAALAARLVSRPRPAYRLRPVLVARYRAALIAERAAEARFSAASRAGR